MSIQGIIHKWITRAIKTKKVFIHIKNENRLQNENYKDASSLSMTITKSNGKVRGRKSLTSVKKLAKKKALIKKILKKSKTND
jgi:hypothetical protein